MIVDRAGNLFDPTVNYFAAGCSNCGARFRFSPNDCVLEDRNVVTVLCPTVGCGVSMNVGNGHYATALRPPSLMQKVRYYLSSK